MPTLVRRPVAAFLTVVAVGSVVAGCGGDEPAETVAPAEWAATVCHAVGAATEDLAEAVAIIDRLPAEVAADAALGDQADDLRRAFAALPSYVARYLDVVEVTPVPDTADGAAFRDEVLADLAEAAQVFGRAAIVAEGIDGDTTVEGFFTSVQSFARFPEAFAASDLTFDTPPPGVEEAMAAEPTCGETRRRLAGLIG